jgi:hypothetical protein
MDDSNLCLERLDYAVMDTHESQILYVESQEFYKGLNMEVKQLVPLPLLER